MNNIMSHWIWHFMWLCNNVSSITLWSLHGYHNALRWLLRRRWQFYTFHTNLRGSLKNHCTNTRLVCTHLNVFFTLNSYMAMKFEFRKYLKKKEKKKISACRLHTTSAKKGINMEKNCVINHGIFQHLSLNPSNINLFSVHSCMFLTELAYIVALSE